MLDAVDPELATAPMTLRQSIGLRVSVALIAVYWAFTAAAYYAGASKPQEAPSTVTKLAAGVTVNGLLVIAIIAALLWWSGDGARGIGLRRQGAGGQIGRGVLFGVALFVLATFVVSPVVSSMLRPEGGEGDGPTAIPHLFRDVRELPLWIWTGVFGGGVIEELSRIFVLTRFERIAGRTGVVIALIVDTTLFGAGHRYQGLTAVVTTGMVGLACALIYLRRRSLLEVITAHAIFDVIGISLAYALVGAPEQAAAAGS